MASRTPTTTFLPLALWQPVLEDPVYIFRAAGAALLSEISYETGQAVHGETEAMKMLRGRHLIDDLILPQIRLPVDLEGGEV
jgi:hypothetical protein